jgi:ADP-heptose:LPS heptosyltransferase
MQEISKIHSRLQANISAWKTQKKVAWLRSGAIGDLIVGLASLAEMPRFFPEAKITVIGPDLWLQLLDPKKMSYIEKIIVVPRKKTFGRIYISDLAEGKWKATSDQDQPLTQLLSEYDCLVNTNTDSFRYGFVGLRAGVPLRIGSAPAQMAWLYHFNAPHFGKDPLLHERDLPLLLLEYATPGLARFFRQTKTNRSCLETIVQKSELVGIWRKQGLPSLRDYSAERQAQLTHCAQGKYVIINPTASRREKTWPTSKVRELLSQCKEEFARRELEPIIVGAPNETDWLREVAMDDYRIVQPKSLSDLQEIVRGARALLTNGSSMQFVAGTTQTPTLTIFGRGQPIIWGPVGPHDRYVRARFENADAGSTFSGFAEEERIYQTIPVEEVATAFMDLISATDGEKQTF